MQFFSLVCAPEKKAFFLCIKYKNSFLQPDAKHIDFTKYYCISFIFRTFRAALFRFSAICESVVPKRLSAVMLDFFPAFRYDANNLLYSNNRL